jgi:hypothetical protein
MNRAANHRNKQDAVGRKKLLAAQTKHSIFFETKREQNFLHCNVYTKINIDVVDDSPASFSTLLVVVVLTQIVLYNYF